MIAQGADLRYSSIIDDDDDAFISAYINNQPLADFNGDGEISPQDILDFSFSFDGRFN